MMVASSAGTRPRHDHRPDQIDPRRQRLHDVEQQADEAFQPLSPRSSFTKASFFVSHAATASSMVLPCSPLQTVGFVAHLK